MKALDFKNGIKTFDMELFGMAPRTDKEIELICPCCGKKFNPVSPRRYVRRYNAKDLKESDVYGTKFHYAAKQIKEKIIEFTCCSHACCSKIEEVNVKASRKCYQPRG
jgi:hypothetical protein